MMRRNRTALILAGLFGFAVWTNCLADGQIGHSSESEASLWGQDQNLETGSFDGFESASVIDADAYWDEEPVIPETEPADADFVRVRDYVPHIGVDLRYATMNNFTGTVIYDFNEAYLRYGTVKKLAEVQKELDQQGLHLLIWDAYRPVYAQWRLWEVCPNPVYVANPEGGITSHSRGDTIDISLVYDDMTPVEMPTGFDDFSTLADRDYSDCAPEAAENASMFQNLMYNHGFTGYQGEWWDFSDVNQYWDGYEYIPPR